MVSMRDMCPIHPLLYKSVAVITSGEAYKLELFS